jgi:hypothetical protein
MEGVEENLLPCQKSNQSVMVADISHRSKIINGE